MRARLLIAAFSLAPAGCGANADSCGNGAVEPGEVCLAEIAGVGGESAQVLMDFDGDGIADLVALGETSARFLHNRGDATFEAVGDVGYEALGGTPTMLHDVDEDGVDELAVPDPNVQEGPRDVAILQRDRNGAMRVRHQLHLPWSIDPMLHVVGDFDGDGRRDLVVYSPDAMALFHGTENGFADAVEVAPFGFSPDGHAEVLTGDLDGDGTDELHQPRPDHLHVRSGADLGTEELLAWPSGCAWAELGDIDGDGADEVVAYREDHGEIRVSIEVFERAGAGQPLASVGVTQSEGVSLRLADLNGDGLDDVVLTGEKVDDAPRSSVSHYGESGRVQLAFGDGTFDDPIEVEGLHAAIWRPAHLDDDGSLDLARFRFREPCVAPDCWVYDGALVSSF